MSAYDALQARIAEINDLLNTINILNWDARTQMPAGGAETRGQQMATLSRIVQERFTSEALADCLARAESELGGADPDSYAVRAVRQTREAFDVARRIPPGLPAEIATLDPVMTQVWAAARAANDFGRYAPYLERMVGLNRRLAEAIGYKDHPYDALLLKYEPGMSVARLRALFAELKASTLPLLKRIAERGEVVDASFLEQDYPEDQQRAFALEVSRAFGYDLRRGRLDNSAHPFEVSFTREDVRITTRYNRRYLPAAVFGLFHETGHALYEQGVDPALTRTALATDLLGRYAVGGVSYGAHESQSRLWENLVGRSRSFWARHFPRLREYFPEQLRGWMRNSFTWRSTACGQATSASKPTRLRTISTSCCGSRSRSRCSTGRWRSATCPPRGTPGCRSTLGSRRPTTRADACRTSTGRTSRSARSAPTPSGTSSPRSSLRRRARACPGSMPRWPAVSTARCAGG